MTTSLCSPPFHLYSHSCDKDEFGGEISGDIIFVNISYVVAFLFLGATLGSKVCGQGSRWAMSLSAVRCRGHLYLDGTNTSRRYTFPTTCHFLCILSSFLTIAMTLSYIIPPFSSFSSQWQQWQASELHLYVVCSMVSVLQNSNC